jgi:lysozyme
MDQAAALSTAVNFIAGLESFSPSPYWDVNGYAIGYGNHYYTDGTTVEETDSDISQSDAMDLLTFFVNQDLNNVISQITAPLNENQFAALTSLYYNCGTDTNTLVNLINSGAQPSDVAAQIQKTCITSGGVANASLIVRRQQEAALYTSSSVPASWLLIGAAALFIVGGIVLMNRRN